MKLNCTVNCIAEVKSSAGPNVGRYVQCLRLIPDQLWHHADGTQSRLPTWELDSEVVAWDGARHRFCPDENLRPISTPGRDGLDARDTLVERTPVRVGLGAEA